MLIYKRFYNFCKKYRIERDSFGDINVESDKLWGAQTQRSLQNFKVCQDSDQMPIQIIQSLAILKKSIAIVNKQFKLDKEISDAIQIASQEIIDGKHDNQFPLVVWQTGSGTQTNMNVNEVIANRAMQINEDIKVHPNDHVNQSQSSNDTFPSAMHISVVLQVYDKLLPALVDFEKELQNKQKEFKGIIKIGRTHTQDATPLLLSQEFSGYQQQITNSIKNVYSNIQNLKYLAQGGTAVGTGLNSFKGFDVKVADQVSKETGIDFQTSPNKFESLQTCDQLVLFSGVLNQIAVSLFKIANDIRLLGSGPRSGLGELQLPENEPGSSIMPGKVNPTQCEMLTMVCCQVFGNHQAVTIGGSQGHFELNVYRPMIVKNIIHSINLLSDGVNSFNENCLKDLKANNKKIDQLLNNSLMLVTALNFHIGYDNASKIAKHAHKNDLTLKQAAIELKLLTEEEYDKLIVPSKMLYPKEF